MSAQLFIGFAAGAVCGGTAFQLMQSNSSNDKKKIELFYWNGRGLMEVPRMLLASKKQFPGDYDDGRYTTDEPYGIVKSYNLVKDKMQANLGRMPILGVDGEFIGQSCAINYYLAKTLGLMGSSDVEAAQIISIQEHLREMKMAFFKMCPYGETPTPEALNTWFDEGNTDSSGPAVMKDRNKRYLKWFVGRIESVVGDDGFAIGGKLSLADLLIYNIFAETLLEDECADYLKDLSWKREPFADLARTNKALEAAPKTLKICETVRSNPGIKKWLSERGQTNKQRF